MLQANLQIVSVSQVDLMEVDAIFKRIAERGHKVRTQTNLEGNEAPQLQVKESEYEQSTQVTNANIESK